MTAPFGRRLCEVVARTAPRAATASSRCSTARGPSRCRASSTCWPPRATGPGAGERPFLPRAISVAETGPAADGVRLDFLSRPSAPAPTASASWSRGRGSGSPARSATPSPSRARSAPAPPARSWSAAASASPRWPCCAAASASATSPLRVLLGFRDQAHSGGLDDSSAAPAAALPEVRLATEDGHAGHRGYVTDLLAAMLAGDDADQRRRLLLRPAADAGGGRARSATSATSPASWR